MSDNLQRKCEAFAERLSLFAMGELSEGDQAVVTQHLATCDRCRKRLVQLELVARSLACTEPDWLEESAESVLSRVTAAIRGGNKDSLSVLSSVSGEVVDRRRSLLVSGAEHRRLAWLITSSVVVVFLGTAAVGWRAGWWQATSVPSTVPALVSDMKTTSDPGFGAVSKRAPGECPTWWELQRSLADSEEAFEQALVCGHSGGALPPVEMHRLLQELTE